MSTPTSPDFRALNAELHRWVFALASSHQNISESTRAKIAALSVRCNAARSQPEPEEVTDEELERRYLAWWHNEGSGLLPHPGMDHEAHVRHVSEIAWANGAYAARYPVPPSSRCRSSL